MRLTFAAGMAAILTSVGMPALAATEPAQFVISNASAADSDGWTVIDVLILNSSADDQQIALPDRIAGTITSDTERPIQLERAPGEQASVALPARGFARTHYRAMVHATAALISVPEWSTPNVALPASPAASVQQAQAAPPASPSVAEPTYENPGEASLLRHISAHEPTFALFGNAKDSEILLQASFKYRVLGSSRPNTPLGWQDGIYFAYTQKMYINLAADSSIETDYTPELFYRSPALSVNDAMQVGIDLGVGHESNGRAGVNSRSLNTVFVSPSVMWDLGGDYDLKLSPRYWLLIGGRAGNPDIKAYRGSTGLKAEFGQKDGLRLAATGRMNVSNGRGALIVEPSYPLSGVLDAVSGFYVFGQFFTGYGETLLDYNRRATRLRVGFGIAR